MFLKDVKYRLKNSPDEKGSVLLETVIIAPILILIFLFSADFIIYSKTHTFVSQVARDAAIFLATTPEIPGMDGGYNNMHSDPEYQQTCNDPDTYPTFCPHFEAQARAYRSLLIEKYLDFDTLYITTSYDGQDVEVDISIKPSITFFFTNNPIQKNAVLRRVNIS